MALSTAAISPSSCPIMLFKSLPCQLQGPLVRQVSICRTSACNPVKSFRMEWFNEPAKFKVHIDYAMKKLSEFIPPSVQNFPWAKAENAALQHLLALGQLALKWSLTALIILSSASDFIYSISKNKELVIPFGLFCGCVVADFLNETSHELIRSTQERGKNWQLLVIGCFFVLVRIFAICIAVEPQSFLLHAANGGLMQILWQWRTSLQPEGNDANNVPLEDGCSSEVQITRSD
ncbi:uncharacterized protein [Coffea arabica]|uniref:Uncharacterized protein n=1 Tax=Coffea arabica TaxID=13443 RepID=A0A6P6UQT1_COFAR|nr:uncharacterized protein LOC113713623 [Coffea arabica]